MKHEWVLSIAEAYGLAETHVHMLPVVCRRCGKTGFGYRDNPMEKLTYPNTGPCIGEKHEDETGSA